MRAFPLLALTFAVVVMLTTAHGQSACPNTAHPTVTLETHAGLFYVHTPACPDACLPNPVVYEESNGIPGLQVPATGLLGSCEPDTRVF